MNSSWFSQLITLCFSGNIRLSSTAAHNIQPLLKETSHSLLHTVFLYHSFSCSCTAIVCSGLTGVTCILRLCLSVLASVFINSSCACASFPVCLLPASLYFVQQLTIFWAVFFFFFFCLCTMLINLSACVGQSGFDPYLSKQPAHFHHQVIKKKKKSKCISKQNKRYGVFISEEPHLILCFSLGTSVLLLFRRRGTRKTINTEVQDFPPYFHITTTYF